MGAGQPDLVFFTEDGWCLAVECKVQAKVALKQLQRHGKTLQRYGFEEPHLAVIAVDEQPAAVLDFCRFKEWRDVYSWFNKRRSAEWPRRLAHYMEVFESNELQNDYDIRGTITMFDGLNFDDEHPYTAREGRRLIRLLGDELQSRKELHKLGVDPKGARRTGITGRGTEGVWDFLPLQSARHAKEFTSHPHLTMGLKDSHATAALTIPNGVKGGFRTTLKELGWASFADTLREVEAGLRPVLKGAVGSKAQVYATQRHYRSQRSRGEVDARLDADLLTLVTSSKQVKYQPEWIKAIYEVMLAKRSNIQLGIDVQLPYTAPAIQTRKVLDVYAGCWKAMKPLLELARPGTNA